MIQVHGFSGRVSPQLADQVAAAQLVIGGRRHLDALAVDPGRRFELGAPSAAVEQILAAGPEASVVVVASGDPGWFGIVRRLRDQGFEVQVVPQPSSVSLAFAAAALPWDDAEVVSVHGRPLEPAVATCRAYGKVAVLTSAEHGIRELARGLRDLDRVFWLCECLGEDDERVRRFDAAAAMTVEDVSEPNVVLVVDPRRESRVGWRQGAPQVDGALPQVDFHAASIFCQLLPRLGDLLWVRGSTARQVGDLARHNGAAVLEIDDPATAWTLPTWVLVDEADEALLAHLTAIGAAERTMTTSRTRA